MHDRDSRPGVLRDELRAISLSALVASLVLLVSLACSQERVVHRESSDSGEIVVSESPGGIRTLRFGDGGAVQSRVRIDDPLDLLLPYVESSVVAVGVVESPRRILVVGLGGGSIPRFLRARLPDASLVVAEIDPAVVRVAEQWFGVVADERLRLVVADGRDLIERSEDAFDVIVLDAYGPSEVPYRLATEEFLQSVRSALGEGGAVVTNLWSEARNDLYRSMLATYRAVFDEVLVLSVAGRHNRIVVALPWSLQDGGEALVERRLRDVAERLDLGHALDGGLERITEQRFRAPVLRDDDSR